MDVDFANDVLSGVSGPNMDVDFANDVLSGVSGPVPGGMLGGGLVNDGSTAGGDGPGFSGGDIANDGSGASPPAPGSLPVDFTNGGAPGSLPVDFTNGGLSGNSGGAVPYVPGGMPGDWANDGLNGNPAWKGPNGPCAGVESAIASGEIARAKELCKSFVTVPAEPFAGETLIARNAGKCADSCQYLVDDTFPECASIKAFQQDLDEEMRFMAISLCGRGPVNERCPQTCHNIRECQDVASFADEMSADELRGVCALNDYALGKKCPHACGNDSSSVAVSSIAVFASVAMGCFAF